MNTRILRALLLVLICALAIGVWAQTVETKVAKGTVVYVSGNDLVVKGENGQVRHFVVPDSQTFIVDGKNVTVHELKPGTELTATVTTTNTPTEVKTVKTGKGTVAFVSPPYLTVTLENGQNKRVRVPEGQKFLVDGEEKTVFDLRKGMKLSWTMVRTTPQIDVTRDVTVTGQAPPPPPPPTPTLVGALLIEEPPAPAPAPAPAELPKTASLVPLVGLLGLLSLAASFGLGILRRRG